MQEILPNNDLSKREIERIARHFIRGQYGSIPSVGEAQDGGQGTWTVPINASYPRILFNETRKTPAKLRFMRFTNLATLRLSKKGEILDKPKYVELAGVMHKKLREIRESVEKALVKVAADRFSKITFPEHMFTPVQDILSWLLVNDKIPLDAFLTSFSDEKAEKYRQNLDILARVDLVRIDRDIVLAANALVEIEMKSELSRPEQLSAALTVFYSRAYEHLDTISSSLGPHLTLSSYIYQQSVECGQPVALRAADFRMVLADSYADKGKLTKLPRYLLQLEEAGLIVESKEHKNTWEPNVVVLNKLLEEQELIAPLQQMMLGGQEQSA